MEVWTWGKNENGQLGLGDKLERRQPCKVKELSDKQVVKVCAGRDHMLALTSTSQVGDCGGAIT